MSAIVPIRIDKRLLKFPYNAPVYIESISPCTGNNWKQVGIKFIQIVTSTPVPIVKCYPLGEAVDILKRLPQKFPEKEIEIIYDQVRSVDVDKAEYRIKRIIKATGMCLGYRDMYDPFLSHDSEDRLRRFLVVPVQDSFH